MRAELHLQESRRVVVEWGLGLNYDFGPQNAEGVRDLLRIGGLRTNRPEDEEGAASLCWYDDIAGHFMGQPVWALQDMTLDDWSSVAGSWIEEAQPFHGSEDNSNCLVQTSDGAWDIVEATDAAYGQGRMFRFLTYANTEGPVTLFFGGVWKLQLYDHGQATLSQQETVTLDDGSVELVYRNIADFDWMAAEEFKSAVHWLMIYEVRGKLVIRNLARNREGKALGLVYDDTSAQARPDETYAEDEPVELDENGERILHALRGGPWGITGTGPIAINCSNLRYQVGEAILWRDYTPLPPGGSTQPVTVTLNGVGGFDKDANPWIVQAEAIVYTDTGDVWPTSPPGPDPAAHALKWRVSWTSTEASTYYLSAVHIVVPRTTASDGNVGTDVLAISNVSAKRLSLTREGDLTRERFTGTLRSIGLNLAQYCQSNMTVRYVVNGAAVFRGLTDSAEWEVIADTSPPTGDLILSATGLWRRFQRAV